MSVSTLMRSSGRWMPGLLQLRPFSAAPPPVELTRTVTAKDVQEFGRLTGDTNPIHFDGDAAIVHGVYLLGLVSRAAGTVCPGPGSIVLNLESKFVRACPVGSTVRVVLERLDQRKISQFEFRCEDAADKRLIYVQGKLAIRVPPSAATYITT